MRTARTFALIAVPVIAVGVILSVTSGGDDEKASGGCTKVATPPVKDAQLSAPELTIDPNQAYSATLDTTCGTIEIALDAQQPRIAVNNFVALAEQGFYDDLAFVRAATDFVIQAGGPDQTNVGGPGYTVQAEIPTASPAYPVGTVAYAKAGAEPAGSAGSQFFIVTGKNGESLPPEYAVIGTVTKGLAVADRIESFAPEGGDGPLTKTVVMKKVTITTKGIVPPSTAPDTTPTTVTTPSS